MQAIYVHTFAILRVGDTHVGPNGTRRLFETRNCAQNNCERFFFLTFEAFDGHSENSAFWHSERPSNFWGSNTWTWHKRYESGKTTTN